MVEIMADLHNYVPAVSFTEDVYVKERGITVAVSRAIMYPLLFGGDQLTAARGRDAKKVKYNSPSPTLRLDGLAPCAEDWHTKVILLEVYMCVKLYCFVNIK